MPRMRLVYYEACSTVDSLHVHVALTAIRNVLPDHAFQTKMFLYRVLCFSPKSTTTSRAISSVPGPTHLLYIRFSTYDSSGTF